MFEQSRVVLRLQQRVVAEADIKICFLSGSFGRGTQDAFSDIDVVLVYEDDASRVAAYENRQAFVRSVLPYVPANSFDASHVRPYLHIALYGNGAKVDYRYETKESLRPSVWDRKIRLLKDSEGWGEAFQESARQLPGALPLPVTTDEEMAALDERFWIMFMDVYRQVLRGDSKKPFPIYLQLMSFTIPDLLRHLPEQDSARDALIGATYQNDPKVTAGYLRDLLDAYLAARRSVMKLHRLQFKPNEALERELLRKIKP